MTLQKIDVNELYKRDVKLKQEDVKALMEWAEKQPHLPKLSELENVLFLQSCYYSNERAKNTMDTFYTVRSIVPELFKDRNPSNLKQHLEVTAHAKLPKKTPEGYTIWYSKLMDCRPDSFHFNTQLKIWDMMMMLELQENGPSEGDVVVLDYTGIVFGHLTKLSLMTMKKFLYYIQDAMPIRLKGLHFVNIVPFIDKVVAMMKPFMKKELMDMFYLHDNVQSMSKFIPVDCLPSDCGGTAPDCKIFRENVEKKLLQNVDFCLHDEAQCADESKRPGKPRSANEIFGIEGTFKKLDLD